MKRVCLGRRPRRLGIHVRLGGVRTHVDVCPCEAGRMDCHDVQNHSGALAFLASDDISVKWIDDRLYRGDGTNDGA